MTAEVFIPGPLPGLNELIGAAKSGRGRSNAYSRLKSTWTGVVMAKARSARMPKFVDCVSVLFVWREANKRRDIDNVAGGGTKLVLDGLVKAGVLDGDGWKHVFCIEHRFQVDVKKPGVLVVIGPPVPF